MRPVLRPMQYWIKTGGTGEQPLRNEWIQQTEEWGHRFGSATMFSRRPRMLPGDRLVMYAAGSPKQFGAGRIYAVHEVTSEPERSGRHERWPWEVQTTPVVLGPPLLEACPTLDDIEVEARSLRQQGHIRLAEDKGRMAEELLSSAAEMS